MKTETQTLQDRILIDLQTAIGNRDLETKELLKVVISEISRKGSKEVSNDEVLRILKKMKEDAILCGNLNEIPILDKYLPQMLTRDQLEEIIDAIIIITGSNNIKDMGMVMAGLKTHPQSAQIDGKLASVIVREKLK